jgi:hypothetical protein
MFIRVKHFFVDNRHKSDRNESIREESATRPHIYVDNEQCVFNVTARCNNLKEFEMSLKSTFKRASIEAEMEFGSLEELAGYIGEKGVVLTKIFGDDMEIVVKGLSDSTALRLARSRLAKPRRSPRSAAVPQREPTPRPQLLRRLSLCPLLRPLRLRSDRYHRHRKGHPGVPRPRRQPCHAARSPGTACASDPARRSAVGHPGRQGHRRTRTPRLGRHHQESARRMAGVARLRARDADGVVRRDDRGRSSDAGRQVVGGRHGAGHRVGATRRAAQFGAARIGESPSC